MLPRNKDNLCSNLYSAWKTGLSMGNTQLAHQIALIGVSAGCNWATPSLKSLATGSFGYGDPLNWPPTESPMPHPPEPWPPRFEVEIIQDPIGVPVDY
jgi:hypothetical protein